MPCALLQPRTQCLLAHCQPGGTRDLLGHLIADRRLQEQVTPCDPTDSGTLGRPPPPIPLALPSAPGGLCRRLPLSIRHVGTSAQERGLQQSYKPHRRIAGVLILGLQDAQFDINDLDL